MCLYYSNNHLLPLSARKFRFLIWHPTNQKKALSFAHPTGNHMSFCPRGWGGDAPPSPQRVSYRCLPNMGAHIARHNAKILRGASEKGRNDTPPNCNCLKSRKINCPLPGACNQEGVIYQAEITNSNGDSETYVGLAKNFKRRYYIFNLLFKGGEYG